MITELGNGASSSTVLDAHVERLSYLNSDLNRLSNRLLNLTIKLLGEAPMKDGTIGIKPDYQVGALIFETELTREFLESIENSLDILERTI